MADQGITLQPLDDIFSEVVYPPNGMLFKEEIMGPIFCKPKLIPLKSVTLERLEKMQQEGLEKIKLLEQQTELEAKLLAEREAAEQADAAAAEAPGTKADIWQAGYE